MSEILARFSTPVACDAVWFQNEGTLWKFNSSTFSEDNQTSFWLRQYVHPSLNFTIVKYFEMWPNFGLWSVPVSK